MAGIPLDIHPEPWIVVKAFQYGVVVRSDQLPESGPGSDAKQVPSQYVLQHFFIQNCIFQYGRELAVYAKDCA